MSGHRVLPASDRVLAGVSYDGEHGTRSTAGRRSALRQVGHLDGPPSKYSTEYGARHDHGRRHRTTPGVTAGRRRPHRTRHPTGTTQQARRKGRRG
ncbi:hypothetical protein ACIF8T_22445 [Streptomyces sp. NPDC085946]|uniref:hypothetical protein n=1 Tax=Streptomyces sp. NPDC085946 TaxID=3365744 RepID=UPI0037D9583E